ncbi:MAG: AAA family ATPase [Acidobacteriaceae bacterium]
MYKAFYKLARNPFNLTPDPKYLVATSRHDEALATLHYGIRSHKGFVVLTGEVGTGKTLLLRCLLQLLAESEDIAYAYVFNSNLSTIEFLEYVLSDFGLPAAGKNKGELLRALGQFLVSRGSKNQTTVLVIDEAHSLSEELLEEIRILSNLETTDDKLLQVVLVGQPELEQKLDSVQLRQLKQRIALRAHLDPLSIEETEEYVEHRLQVAGAEPRTNSLFPTETIASIYRYSQGFPRLINTLCENALIAAYARRMESVTPEIIAEVAEEFRLETACPPFADENGNEYENGSHRMLEELLGQEDVFEHYPTLRKPVAFKARVNAPLIVEASEHEPYI